MSRVLVTGGAGAIGSHLVERLLAGGHQVLVLDDLSSGRADFVPSEARLVVGSVASQADVDRAFDEARPDHVAHLAALFANQNSVDHPLLDLRVNGEGTLRILETAHQRGGPKVLVCSSSCVYADGQVLEETSHQRSSATPYAITKALGEHYAQYYAAHHGLDVVVVRPFNSYGPREAPGPYRNVIPNFLATALRGEPLTITGTGEETRDFTFVDDLVDGIVAALFGATTSGEVFNLGTGRETKIVDLATLVNEITGNRAGIRMQSRRAWDHTVVRLADISRAEERLSYRPATVLEDGLRRTHDWLRSFRG